jgi:hypothetical protein
LESSKTEREQGRVYFLVLRRGEAEDVGLYASRKRFSSKNFWDV